MTFWLLVALVAAGAAGAKKEAVGDFLACETCKGSVEAFKIYIQRKTGDLSGLYNLLSELCGPELKAVCLGGITEMGPIVLTSTIDRYLDPNFLCGAMGKCAYNVTADDLQSWATAVLASKPNNPLPKASATADVTFAHITDLHFDLEYKQGAATDCGLPLCCRAEYPGTGSAGPFGDYNCDIPYATLASGIEAISALKPDFVLWTGDNPPHNVWNQSQAYNMQYITEANALLENYFKPGVTAVYPTLGNHGCYPVNIYQFGNEAWLTDPIAKMWYPWLNSQAESTIKAFGGYSVLHGNTNLRIIALNTQACNNLNFWFLQNVTDPGNQVEWLQGQLAAAESAGEQVYIIGHIPIGDSDCLSQWGYRYKALMDRYQFTVRGQFFGHTHNDHVKVNRGFFDNSPISVQWIAPSLTTYTNLNPSFRIYAADSNTWLPVNYYQYRLNLTQANLNATAAPQWTVAYDFLSEYNLPDMSVETVYKWALSMMMNEAEMVKFMGNFVAGGPGAPTECGITCRSNEICDLTNGVIQDIWDCQQADPDVLNFFLQILYGPWVYPKV